MSHKELEAKLIEYAEQRTQFLNVQKEEIRTLLQDLIDTLFYTRRVEHTEDGTGLKVVFNGEDYGISWDVLLNPETARWAVKEFIRLLSRNLDEFGRATVESYLKEM